MTRVEARSSGQMGPERLANAAFALLQRFRGTLQLAEAARLISEAPRKECLGVKKSLKVWDLQAMFEIEINFNNYCDNMYTYHA